MKRLSVALVVVAALLAGATLAAQGAYGGATGGAPGGASGGPPPRVLSQATIDHFVSDIPGLIKDFKALGDEYNAQNSGAQAGAGGSPAAAMANAFTAIRADQRARGILVRHGWNDSFWQVYTAIVFGYLATMMDDAATQSQQPAMKQYADQYRAMVNPSDAALVAKNKDRIQQTFESMKDEG
ncbi:MAG TPA: hypothetical protein VMC79_01910 [Rectinemataceae bacterium]|nr:hypothetical protein [Rectinemataceae bacterium]